MKTSILLALVASCALAACGGGGSDVASTEDDTKSTIPAPGSTSTIDATPAVVLGSAPGWGFHTAPVAPPPPVDCGGGITCH